jgi:hypothetical protein
MATIKKCDLCGAYWDPKATRDVYGEYDTMACVVSVIAPKDPHSYRREAYNETHEACQTCARKVIDLLGDLAG